MKNHVRKGWRHFQIALSFLTLIPVFVKHRCADHELAHSVVMYPVIGLLIGVFLFVFAKITEAHHLLSAVLVLAVWVLVTGGLHLDGVADSADAWVGGHQNREKTLTILKDTYCGSAAIVSVVVLLLVKFAAIMTLLREHHLSVLIFIPMVSRTMVLPLFAFWRHANTDFFDATLKKHLPKKAIVVITSVVSLLLILTLQWQFYRVILALLFAVLLLWYTLIRHIKGISGDLLGAFIEIFEVALLVAFAF